MANNPASGITIEIRALPDAPGRYGWTLRRGGKLWRRCDRPCGSEAEARAVAQVHALLTDRS